MDTSGVLLFRASAVERLRLYPYDLLIVDLKMPGMDGLTVVREAKRLKADLPVIIITGYSTEAAAIEALNLGVTSYLTKPFKLAEIEIVANRILEYLILIGDNKRLSSKLAMATEKSATIDSRLERIESLLSSLVAKVST